jgi:hypothetical protein
MPHGRSLQFPPGHSLRPGLPCMRHCRGAAAPPLLSDRRGEARHTVPPDPSGPPAIVPNRRTGRPVPVIPAASACVLPRQRTTEHTGASPWAEIPSGNKAPALGSRFGPPEAGGDDSRRQARARGAARAAVAASLGASPPVRRAPRGGGLGRVRRRTRRGRPRLRVGPSSAVRDVTDQRRPRWHEGADASSPDSPSGLLTDRG